MQHTRDDNPDSTGSAQGDPTSPDNHGKTAGSNTQSQGGISHEVAQQARRQYEPGAGVTDLDQVDPVGLSLDGGGGKHPRDGRAHHGFTGDDGQHLPTDSTAVGANPQPGPVADLGPQQDPRTHGVPQDPAERTTGGDSPNEGGIAGSPGGPRQTAGHIPGLDPDEGMIGGPSGNDTQRDQQV